MGRPRITKHACVCGQAAVDRFKGNWLCAECLNPELEKLELQTRSCSSLVGGGVEPKTGHYKPTTEAYRLTDAPYY